MSNTVHIKKVKTINFSKVKVSRAGFFLYTLYKGKIYIGVGIDSRTHELTDFAGTVKYKLDRNALNGAIRELQEETLEIFETIKYDDIKDCITVYDNNNMIIFMPILIDPDILCYEFNERYRQIVSKKFKIEPEVCGITWLGLDEFTHHIKNPGVIYNRVQDFLLRAGNFTHLL